SPPHFTNGHSTDATIPHPQLAQNSAQSPGLQVTQRGSTFGKAITATGDASIKAGNYVDGVKSGEFDQEGSAYQDNIVSEDKAKVSLGNHMNGQQSG
ncbi:hypothetical protein COCMIDRAFT_98401, partial [Bipolaris oryzae ATCC 44560]